MDEPVLYVCVWSAALLSKIPTRLSVVYSRHRNSSCNVIL